MKVGLKKLPTLKNLEEGYDQILKAQRENHGKIDLNSLSTFCQWTRFDSRMGELCVEFLSRYWKLINPVELHDSLMQQPWPSALGVLLEFCQEESSLFHLWRKTATCDFQKANWEQFFIGKRRIGGRLMQEDVRFSLEEYRRWGYLSREVLRNKQNALTASKITYSAETRHQILKELFVAHPRLTTQQYWKAIGKSVSKRQAERDLKNANWLKSIGKTKGLYFVKR